jgi:hypothetical protein
MTKPFNTDSYAEPSEESLRAIARTRPLSEAEERGLEALRGVVEAQTPAGKFEEVAEKLRIGKLTRSEALAELDLPELDDMEAECAQIGGYWIAPSSNFKAQRWAREKNGESDMGLNDQEAK